MFAKKLYHFSNKKYLEKDRTSSDENLNKGKLEDVLKLFFGEISIKQNSQTLLSGLTHRDETMICHTDAYHPIPSISYHIGTKQ